MEWMKDALFKWQGDLFYQTYHCLKNCSVHQRPLIVEQWLYQTFLLNKSDSLCKNFHACEINVAPPLPMQTNAWSNAATSRSHLLTMLPQSATCGCIIWAKKRHRSPNKNQLSTYLIVVEFSIILTQVRMCLHESTRVKKIYTRTYKIHITWRKFPNS